MHVGSIRRNLSAGTAPAAMLVATLSLASAQSNGVVTGVVNDASGKPVAGAFVKLKNDAKRLTFMAVSREQGRFEAKDLPPGSYRVQGVGGELQSKWSPEVAVAAGGAGAKVTLALTDPRGPALAAAWPHRIPELQAEKASKDPKDLPEGEGKQLVADFCNSCHDLQRTVANRSDPDHWGHTVKRMRTRMIVASMPDLTEQQYQTIVKYLSDKFGPLQPYDANSRLPRTLASGKALNYRAVQYALVDTHAEPHDVAVDPSGNAWVGERAGKLGRLDRNTLEFTEVTTPPGQAAPDRQSLGNPQVDAKGVLWVHDGPNQRWLSYDTNAGKFEIYAFPKGKGNAGGNSMAFHPDGSVWATGGGGQARRLNVATKEFQFFDAPALKARKEAARRLRHGGGGRSIGVVRRGSIRSDGAGRSGERQGRRVQDSVRRLCLSAPHERRRQRRSVGRPVEWRQADEGRSQDQADDDLLAADAGFRCLFGGRGQEEQSGLGQPAAGR